MVMSPSAALDYADVLLPSRQLPDLGRSSSMQKGARKLRRRRSNSRWADASLEGLRVLSNMLELPGFDCETSGSDARRALGDIRDAGRAPGQCLERCDRRASRIPLTSAAHTPTC